MTYYNIWQGINKSCSHTTLHNNGKLICKYLFIMDHPLLYIYKHCYGMISIIINVVSYVYLKIYMITCHVNYHEYTYFCT